MNPNSKIKTGSLKFRVSILNLIYESFNMNHLIFFDLLQELNTVYLVSFFLDRRNTNNILNLQYMS